ncbi:MAG TPA: hypothetical protein VKQ27_03575 [Acetobacteraceae bacterium]|nr:hypothetical protein [Acetobacteraceae bacterium]
MTWLHALGAQKVSAVMLLDELAGQMLGGKRQDQAFEPNAWLRFDNEVAAGRASAAQFARRGNGHRSKRPMELVG